MHSQTVSVLAKKTKPARETMHTDPIDALDRALRRLMWLERAWLKQLLSKYELDIAPFMILGLLSHHDGICGMSELAQELDQPNTTTTGNVARLEKLGLVIREYGNEQDRRTVRVHLTPRGSELVQRVKHARRQHLKRASAHLPARDRVELVRLLQRYLEELEHVK